MPIIPLVRLIPHNLPIHLTDLHLPHTLRPPHKPRLLNIQRILIPPLHQRLEIHTFLIHRKIRPQPLLRLQPRHSRHGRIRIAHYELHDDIRTMSKMNPEHLRMASSRS